jgi:hypothetical protein
MNTAQFRSRERVVDHGEVYTSPREVNAMLDLVKNETERIDSRFLEPACGHGNFLEAILVRKLDVVERRYKKSQREFESQGLIALASIYGIDKLEDNVIDARRRLFQLFLDRYTRLFRNSLEGRYLDSLRYVLERNVIHGDALTLRTIPTEPSPETQNGRPTLDSLRNEGKPILFSHWSLIDPARVKRHDYLFEHLVNRIGDGPLFSDQGEEAFIPKSVAEFKPVHYLEISYAYDDAV